MSFPLSQDSRITRFYDYWDSLREDGGIPGQSAFDPVEVGPLLRTLWMARWDIEFQDFVYRLAGESILAAFPDSIRHKPLAEIYDKEHADELRARYQRICAAPAAFYARGQVYRHLKRYGTGERLVLPLLDHKGRPTIVIGCTTYSTSNWRPSGNTGSTSQETGLSHFTTLDGEPLEQIRAAS